MKEILIGFTTNIDETMVVMRACRREMEALAKTPTRQARSEMEDLASFVRKLGSQVFEMKEGQGQQQDDMRLKLPLFPEEKDDVFTAMGQLFIDTYDELIRAIEILKVRQADYVEARQSDIDAMPMRYLEIIKEYQAQLFAQYPEIEGEKEGEG